MRRVLLALALCGAARSAEADEVRGADGYVASAQTVLLVEMQASARARVLEVLEGIDPRPSIALGSAARAGAQRAVVLILHQPPNAYQPAIQAALRTDATPPPMIWPVRADGSLDTGDVPAQSMDGKLARFLAGQRFTLDDLRQLIAQQAPFEVDLSKQAVDAVLFPARHAALAARDPARARYVRAVVALRGLDRDVGALAALLESPETATRDAASAKLHALTGARITPPDSASPAALAAWASAWQAWSTAHADGLIWDEARRTWAQRSSPSSRPTSPRVWPPIPAGAPAPKDAPPPALLRALAGRDDDALEVALRSWLDSGVMRDRQLHLASQLPVSGYSAPPRVAPEIFSGALPSDRRFVALAQVALDWNFTRFVAERAAAQAELAAASPCSEIVRRAAYWELADTNLDTPARVAIHQLAACPDDPSRTLLLALFRNGIDDGLLDATRARIKAGDAALADGLVQIVREQQGEAAAWAGRLLAQEGIASVVPPLIASLRSPRAKVRENAAFDLCWIPKRDAVPALLAALKIETDASARSEELAALSETGDRRAFDVLFAAARAPRERDRIEIIRGLSRIGDVRALSRLATLALRDGEDARVVMEAVDAFGLLSGLFEGRAASAFWSGGGMDPSRMKTGLAAIKAWQARQREPRAR